MFVTFLSLLWCKLSTKPIFKILKLLIKICFFTVWSCEVFFLYFDIHLEQCLSFFLTFFRVVTRNILPCNLKTSACGSPLTYTHPHLRPGDGAERGREPGRRQEGRGPAAGPGGQGKAAGAPSEHWGPFLTWQDRSGQVGSSKKDFAQVRRRLYGIPISYLILKSLWLGAYLIGNENYEISIKALYILSLLK